MKKAICFVMFIVILISSFGCSVNTISSSSEKIDLISNSVESIAVSVDSLKEYISTNDELITNVTIEDIQKSDSYNYVINNSFSHGTSFNVIFGPQNYETERKKYVQPENQEWTYIYEYTNYQYSIEIFPIVYHSNEKNYYYDYETKMYKSRALTQDSLLVSNDFDYIIILQCSFDYIQTTVNYEEGTENILSTLTSNGKWNKVTKQYQVLSLKTIKYTDLYLK